MKSVREVLIELFREGTPESPVDVYWQNEQFREIFRHLFPELVQQAGGN